MYGLLGFMTVDILINIKYEINNQDIYQVQWT